MENDKPTREGLPIVAGKPYDEEDEFADAILRGIDKGIEQRKAREAERAVKAPPKRRTLPPGFRVVDAPPGTAFIIPGFPKP